MHRKLLVLCENCPGENIGFKFIPSESELFRDIPESVSEPFRVITNQSKKRFVSRVMKNSWKSNRLNPIQSKWIQIILTSYLKNYLTNSYNFFFILFLVTIRSTWTIIFSFAVFVLTNNFFWIHFRDSKNRLFLHYGFRMKKKIFFSKFFVQVLGAVVNNCKFFVFLITVELLAFKRGHRQTLQKKRASGQDLQLLQFSIFFHIRPLFFFRKNMYYVYLLCEFLINYFK